jgi:hypothetical protein
MGWLLSNHVSFLKFGRRLERRSHRKLHHRIDSIVLGVINVGPPVNTGAVETPKDEGSEHQISRTGDEREFNNHSIFAWAFFVDFA